MHNLIFNKNDSRICFFKLQIQRKQRHSSELRHSLIAYPIKTKLVLDKKKMTEITGLLIHLSYYLPSNQHKI